MGEAVASLQQTSPDITHSSLRFLEREGFIAPQRTRGGHRLFRDGDLARIRLIKRWQSSRLSLSEIRDRLTRMDALETPSALSNHFLDRAIAGDVAGAAQVVLLADDLGMPLHVMFEDVLAPSLVEVGNRWAAGELSVGQEHEISHLARELIANLTLRHWNDETGPPVILAATIAGELHELGLRMLVALLRQRAAHVHYLGADVSSDILIDAIHNRQPDVILLSISIEDHLPMLHQTLAAIAAEDFGDHSPVVFVGGPGAASLAGEPLAVGSILPANLSLPETIDRIMSAAAPGAATETEPESDLSPIMDNPI
jgi:DNA-binding transcriptional MerR regulator/methylmalonyl-CoA mutase cobalamin-binding subunit